MTEYKKYFIVGTNDNALHDTMNGNVTGKLILCRECIHHHGHDCENMNYRWTSDDFYCGWAERKEE